MTAEYWATGKRSGWWKSHNSWQAKRASWNWVKLISTDGDRQAARGRVDYRARLRVSHLGSANPLSRRNSDSRRADRCRHSGNVTNSGHKSSMVLEYSLWIWGWSSPLSRSDIIRQRTITQTAAALLPPRATCLHCWRRSTQPAERFFFFPFTPSNYPGHQSSRPPTTQGYERGHNAHARTHMHPHTCPSSWPPPLLTVNSFIHAPENSLYGQSAGRNRQEERLRRP